MIPDSKAIPITVFTGFLGSGKTTTILSLLPQLPEGYKVVLLKNEYGDVEVDSKLAKQSALTAVNEILNGCMCCILVGQMKTALLEIKETHNPDRIIIETSGSAFPATLAFQIRELEKETSGGLKLDAIITVIDAENFTGYEDTSTTAKMQAAYTDILLVNKWELVSERQLDIVMDHLFTLNESTPKIKCNGRSGVSLSLLFGLDSKLFSLSATQEEQQRWFRGGNHHDEVETVSLLKVTHEHNAHCDHSNDDAVGQVVSTIPLYRGDFIKGLDALSKECVFRLKGFVRLRDNLSDNALEGRVYILNWAFGRYDLSLWETEELVLGPEENLKLTMMGERGEVAAKATRFAATIGANVERGRN